MESIGQPPASQFGSDYEPAPVTVPALAPAEPVVRRARIGLVALVVLVSMIVVLAAGANQWVSDRLSKRILTDGPNTRPFEGAWLTYGWRFAPRSGDHLNLWLSSLLLVLVTIGLTTLITFALLRGPVTFFRAFFGIWLAVVGATQVGAFVRSVVVKLPKDATQGNRVVRGMFGTFGPSSSTVWASAALGLVVGLIAAIVAVATRRKTGGPVPAPLPAAPPTFPDYLPPGEMDRGPTPPPWQDRYAGPPAPTDATVSFEKTEPTTQLPDAEALAVYGRAPADEPARSAFTGEAFTTELPRIPAPEPHEAEQTTQLPVVRDDGSQGTHETTRLPVVEGEPVEVPAPAAAPAPEPVASEPVASEPVAPAPVAPSAPEPPAPPASAAPPAELEPTGPPRTEFRSPAAPSVPTPAAAPPVPPPAAAPPPPTAPVPAMPPAAPRPAEDFPRPPDDEDIEPNLDGS